MHVCVMVFYFQSEVALSLGGGHNGSVMCSGAVFCWCTCVGNGVLVPGCCGNVCCWWCLIVASSNQWLCWGKTCSLPI